ncbi:hypothetical protein BT63DRAFT_453520 [Microthyrium microscopicum]|uniref:Uncharacterized protein n=1 Tax=Microthyrium microscopicum TaxID=703497 RepID=A0A6A6UI66_9PEZI|nr:hypothetical protein BT63DRAFT_453520 [Microthyrium microscopicum]
MYATRSPQQAQFRPSEQPDFGSRRQEAALDFSKLFYNTNLDAYRCEQKPPGDVWLRVRHVGRPDTNTNKTIRDYTAPARITPTRAELNLDNTDDRSRVLWIGMSPARAKDHSARYWCPIEKIHVKRYKLSANESLESRIRDKPHETNILDPCSKVLRVVATFTESTKSVIFRALVEPDADGVCCALRLSLDEVFFAPEYRDDTISKLEKRSVVWKQLVNAATQRYGGRVVAETLERPIVALEKPSLTRRAGEYLTLDDFTNVLTPQTEHDEFAVKNTDTEDEDYIEDEDDEDEEEQAEDEQEQEAEGELEYSAIARRFSSARKQKSASSSRLLHSPKVSRDAVSKRTSRERRVTKELGQTGGGSRSKGSRGASTASHRESLRSLRSPMDEPSASREREAQAEGPNRSEVLQGDHGANGTIDQETTDEHREEADIQVHVSVGGSLLTIRDVEFLIPRYNGASTGRRPRIKLTHD